MRQLLKATTAHNCGVSEPSGPEIVFIIFSFSCEENWQILATHFHILWHNLPLKLNEVYGVTLHREMQKCVYYALQCFSFMGHIWILFSFLLRLPRILHIFALPIERSACIIMKICLWAPHTNSPYLGNTFHLTWQPPIVQWLCREYEKEFIWKASKFAKKYCKVSHTDTLLHYGKPFLRRFLN